MKKRKGKISMRARRYIKNKVGGMSDYQAAIKAGYAHATAIKASSRVEKGRAGVSLQKLMEKKGLTDDLLLTKNIEGLEAQKIHGTVDNFVEVPDMAVRHKYLETAFRLKGYGPHDKININIDARRQYVVSAPERSQSPKEAK